MVTTVDPPRPRTELFLLALWLVLFTRLDALVGRDVVTATANALTLQSIERAMHLDVEVSVNTWLAGHSFLSQPAVYLYRLYYLVVAGVLGWILVRRTGVYRQVRRTLVAMTAIVLLVYRAVPMSPPRFALPGAIDVVARHDIVNQAAWTHPSHYTAMPSMHVGWALWCAYAVWSAMRGTHPRRALLAWLFPLLMALVVLGTGNHYVLDIAGSVILLALSVSLGHAAANLLRAPHTIRGER